LSKFEISKETRDRMVAEIKDYFLVERNEELGDLAAMLILDFFEEKMAPEFYNQGIYDAHKYMTRAAQELLGIQK
jgi:uncharacterized protein (DUF2164 family)